MRIVCEQCHKDNEVDVEDGKIVYCYNTCFHVWEKMFSDAGKPLWTMNIKIKDGTKMDLKVEYREIGNNKVEMDFTVFHQIMGYLQGQDKINLMLEKKV
jgi:hypothetical protein